MRSTGLLKVTLIVIAVGLSAGIALAQTAPTLINNAPTSTNATTATLAGTVTSTGGAPTTVFTYWGDNDAGTVSTSWDYVITNGVLGEVGFTTNISGLWYGIRYYYRCYATNSAGTNWAPSTTNFVTASPSSGPLTNQLGILDLTANGGTNPATGLAWQGLDTYRFIFVSSEMTNAQSTNITDYNNFVQSLADASPLGIGASEGATWKILGSTATVFARSNTLTSIEANGPGESIWMLNGTSLIFDDYEDMWSSQTAVNINRTELLTVPPKPNTYTDTWCGIRRFAYPNSLYGTTEQSGEVLGNVGGTTMCGLHANNGNGTQWIWRWSNPTSTDLPVYGLSMPLEIQGNFYIYNRWATRLSHVSADIIGRLAATGAVCDVTVYWSTSNNADAAEWLADGSASNAYIGWFTNVSGLTITQSIDSLVTDTTYYFAFMATNDATNIWGSPNGTFSTLDAYYWDGGTTNIPGEGNASSAGGSGLWNTGTQNWDQGYAAHIAWPNTTNAKAVFATSAGTVQLDTDITLGGILIEGAATYSIGTADETHTLNFGGTNTVTVNGVSATFRAGITGSPAVVFSSSSDTLTLSPAASVTMAVGQVTGYNNNAGNYNLVLNGSTSGNTAGQINYQRTGAAHRWFVTKNGTGTWTIDGFGGNANETDVYVNDGTLAITGDVDNVEWIRVGNTPGDDAVLEFANSGASLDPGRFEAYGGIISNSSGGTVTFTDGDLYLRSDGITFTGDDMDLGTGSGTMQSSDNPVTVTAGTTVTIGGVLDDGLNDYHLRKKGAGTLALAASNTYNGNTYVDEGTLSNAYPCLDDVASLSISNGATVELGYTGTDMVLAVFFDGVLAAAGTWGSPTSGADNTTNALVGPGILAHTSGYVPTNTWYWDGPLYGGTGNGASDGGSGIWSTSTNNWDQGYYPRQNWPNTTNDAAILGTTAGTADLGSDITLGSLFLEQASTWYIGDASETYTLNFGGSNTITSYKVWSVMRCGITGQPTIEYHQRGNSHSDYMKLEPAANVTMDVGTINVTKSGTHNLTFYFGGSSATNTCVGMTALVSAHVMTIYKQGSSVWKIGDVNGNRTAWEIEAGTMYFNGEVTGGDRTVTVESGGTLAGTGSVSDMPVTVNAGGTLAPGDPTGTMTNESCAINGTLLITVDSSQSPNVSCLAVANNLNISSATLDVDIVSNPGGAVIIADYSAGSLTGTFSATNNLPGTWSIDYNYESGNQIALIGPPTAPGGTIFIFE